MIPATVLVVDDSATKRYLLVSWLTRAGFTVRRGGDRRRGAAACCPASGVDLVVLDVKLPDMSGFEVCERIKTDPEYGVLPVIHVSAHAVDVVDRTQGLNRGADAYLVEPIEPDELIATAQAVLRYYRARQRAESLAARMVRLAETTLAINSASTLAGLLQAAAAGAHDIFGGPVVVVAETAEGESLAAVGDAAACGAAVVARRTQTWRSARWCAPTSAGRLGRRRLARGRVGRGGRGPAAHRPAAGLRGGAEPARRTPASRCCGSSSQAVAAAVEAQRSYDEEHRIAVTLQRSLLQSRLPDVPGLELAVRYEPAGAQTEVGGDFYELTMLDGRLLVAIGDVAGHSLHAATVMAEVRHAVRAYAVEGHPPGAVLELVNRFMRTVLPTDSATLCLLTLDPATGRGPDGQRRPPAAAAAHRRRGQLPGSRAARCSASTRPRPADLEFVLPPGGTLVLYTDGLIERRDADIDVGPGRAGPGGQPRSRTRPGRLLPAAARCSSAAPGSRPTTSPWSRCAGSEAAGAGLLVVCRSQHRASRSSRVG